MMITPLNPTWMTEQDAISKRKKVTRPSIVLRELWLLLNKQTKSIFEYVISLELYIGGNTGIDLCLTSEHLSIFLVCCPS